MKKTFSYALAGVASAIMALSSGCVSGGFKLTKDYARWVNSQNIILRIILYILTAVVFVVTLIVDVVYNNTVDFWEGKVSEGTYEFKDQDKVYIVRHEYLPGTKLRRSTIQFDQQEIVISETAEGQIEVHKNGQKFAFVNGLDSFPVMSYLNNKGQIIKSEVIPDMTRSQLASH